MQLTKTESICGVIDRLAVNQARCPSLAELGLLEVGITHAGDGWCFIRPDPDFGLAIVTITGAGAVVCDGDWREAGQETAYVMPPGVPHGYRVCRKAGEWKYAWAKFEAAGKYPEIFKKRNPVLAPAASYSLEAANRGLFAEVTRGNHPQLAGVWCDLIRASLANLMNRHTVDPRIEKLWDVVSQRLGETWEVDDLAAEAHVGREHLRRLCQRHYGCSPRHRLTQLRLRKACEWLLLTDNTLDVIAEQVGFGDAFSFSKAFAREYGTPPSKYREKARTAARDSGLV